MTDLYGDYRVLSQHVRGMDLHVLVIHIPTGQQSYRVFRMV